MDAPNIVEKPSKKPTKAAVYAWVYPHLQRIARDHGYALGLHGSMARDIDLIAAPWTESASPAETLVAAIMAFVGGEFAPWDIDAGRNPCIKPHGRRAWSIYFSGHAFYIDLSIMPLAPPVTPAATTPKWTTPKWCEHCGSETLPCRCQE